MKVQTTKRLIGKGTFAPSDDWKSVRQSAISAIEGVVWPLGGRDFTINPARKGNGVVPIQKQVAQLLEKNGWTLQERWPIPDIKSPGQMDGAFRTPGGLVAFEWETGNIASSHRSLNKMCLGLHLGTIVGGILAISANELAQYLTDRVGNIGEIERYFPLWAATPCDQGVLEVIVVAQDRESTSVPLIPKSRTGRAAISD